MLRCIALTVGLLAALPAAVAGEMTPTRPAASSSARHSATPASKERAGRVASTPTARSPAPFKSRASGPVRYAQLPANTLQVRGGSVCASLRGLPLQPCFNLERTSDTSFRGSISGLGFASCDFTRHGAQTVVAHSVHRSNSAQPLGLRPSLTADND